MSSVSQTLPLSRRSVIRDGVRGRITMVRFRHGTFLLALLEYEDGTSEMLTKIDEVERLLLPEESVENSSTAKQEEDEPEEEVAQPKETPKPSLSPVRGIPMPPIGKDDAHYMYGMTGRWYPKQLAYSANDTRLVDWIDRDYDLNGAWPGERICDQRIDDQGQVQYLIKFKRYELNPGVEGEEANEGDWFYASQNIATKLLRDWKRVRRQYGHRNLSDHDDANTKRSDDDSDIEEQKIKVRNDEAESANESPSEPQDPGPSSKPPNKTQKRIKQPMTRSTRRRMTRD